MKNLKKTLMIFAVVLCMAICFFAVEASAGSVILDTGTGASLDYSIEDGGAVITTCNNVSGDIVIPATVTEGGKEYPVTGINDSAFVTQSYITGVTIPDTVTSIGDSAFLYCSSLKSVIIPDSVTTIGAASFSYCRALTSVTIGKSVTSIPERAFCTCPALTSVTIPDSVTSIGEEAFEECTALQSVTMGKNVADIGGYAFYECSAIEDINIPDTVASIGEYAFYRCSALKSVNIPDSLTSISRNTFYGCSSLTEVTIPESVTIIEKRAFRHCSGLESITIPDSVTSIGEYAFDECSSAASLTIGKNVSSIGELAFCECKLSDITVDEENSTFDSRNNCNAIIETATNTLVVACNSTIIPDDITAIGDYAYAYTDITSITIPSTVTSIGYGAFGGSDLTDITIPDSVSSLGDMVFVGCESLKSATIGDGVESIGEMAFYGCPVLTSVTIGDGVKSIETAAFYECSALTTVNYSCVKDVTEITIGADANPEIITDTSKWTKSHILGDYVYNNDATCTEDGTKTAKCGCGEVKDTIAAEGTKLGHDWNSGTISTEATCTTAGVKTYTCTRSGCGVIKMEMIAPTGHKAVAIPAVAATCTTAGSTEGSKCSVCNEILVAPEVIPALGHVDENGDNICDVCSADLTPASSDEDETGCHWCYMKTQTTSILHLIYSLVDFIHHALGVFSNMFD